VDVYIHVFLTSALVGSQWSASIPGRFTSSKEPRNPLDRRLHGPQNKSGRCGEEQKILPLRRLELWALSRPGRSQSLYRLPYPIKNTAWNAHLMTQKYIHSRTWKCSWDVLCSLPHLSIYGSTALVDLGRFFSFLIHTQSVGLLGRGISPSQGRYLHTE
jgi:hypothetical protein